MVENRRGAIVTMASLAGLVVKESRVSYSASKAAVIHMTRARGLDLVAMGFASTASLPASPQRLCKTRTPLKR
jgi:short-subunit dehydrogenase